MVFLFVHYSQLFLDIIVYFLKSSEFDPNKTVVLFVCLHSVSLQTIHFLWKQLKLLLIIHSRITEVAQTH